MQVMVRLSLSAGTVLRVQVDKSVVDSIFEDGGNGSTQQSGTGQPSSQQSPPPSAPGVTAPPLHTCYLAIHLPSV